MLARSSEKQPGVQQRNLMLPSPVAWNEESSNEGCFEPEALLLLKRQHTVYCGIEEQINHLVERLGKRLQ